MPDTVSLLRRSLPFLTVMLLVAVAYDGWIFYSRWRTERDAERARQEQQIHRARESIALMGGTSFRIVNFYAVPATVRRGAKAKICYGVFGAESVRIEPPVAKLFPAFSDCFEVAPRKDTEYKLIADDGAGHTVSQRLAIKVMR